MHPHAFEMKSDSSVPYWSSLETSSISGIWSVSLFHINSLNVCSQLIFLQHSILSLLSWIYIYILMMWGETIHIHIENDSEWLVSYGSMMKKEIRSPVLNTYIFLLFTYLCYLHGLLSIWKLLRLKESGSLVTLLAVHNWTWF